MKGVHICFVCQQPSGVVSFASNKSMICTGCIDRLHLKYCWKCKRAREVESFYGESNLCKGCNRRASSERKARKKSAGTSGVYAISLDDVVVYVGQSSNVEDRVKQHLAEKRGSGQAELRALAILVGKDNVRERLTYEVTAFPGGDLTAITAEEDRLVRLHEPRLNQVFPIGMQPCPFFAPFGSEELLSLLHCKYEQRTPTTAEAHS